MAEQNKVPERGSRLKDEILAVIMVAFGIFLITAFHTSLSGTAGELISYIFKGLFGAVSYGISYFLILLAVLVFAKLTVHLNIVKFIWILMILITASVINSCRYICADGFKFAFGFSAIGDYYNSGTTGTGGGLFGMYIGQLTVKAFGMWGTYTIAVLMGFFFIFLIISNPMSRFFQRRGDKRAAKKAVREEAEFEQKLARDRVKLDAEDGDFKGTFEDESKPASFAHRENEVDNNLYYEEQPDAHEISASEIAKRRGQIVDYVNDFDNAKSDDFPCRTDESGSHAEQKNINFENTACTAAATVNDDENPKHAVNYRFPPVSLLEKNGRKATGYSVSTLRMKAAKLEETLRNFRVAATVVDVKQGPAVTRYEIQPDVGVKVNSIVRLADDIALNMAAKSIRIEAPIPGKKAVGIEIENESVNMVKIREIIDSPEFKKAKSKISFAVGRDIAGRSIVANLKEMPHLLIAGATGSGKSVCVNSIIASILYKARPEEVKLILVDPKVVELTHYNGIPHLLIPVVTEPVKAAAALNWACAEMDERYKKFAGRGVRDLESYNSIMISEEENDMAMPQIVIIIDELADLMMEAPSQVEDSICRLAQKARAAGMHLIVATQRPSVDVITGVIKANIPSRIAFTVSSQFDSRTILDMAGAEKLVGKGDMLFSPVGINKPLRVQGTFISDNEVKKLICFVRDQVEESEYSDEVIQTIEAGAAPGDNSEETDELLPEAIDLVIRAGQASASMLQRRFRVGYNRAARMIDMMEERRIIGPSEGSKPRQVLITEEEFEKLDI